MDSPSGNVVAAPPAASKALRTRAAQAIFGKSALQLRQVLVINEVFTPTSDEMGDEFVSATPYIDRVPIVGS